MTKKLLYICSRAFWPPMGGHETEMYYYCRGLHEILRYSIDVYIFDERDVISIDNKPAFIDQVFIAESIARFIKIKNIVTKSVINHKPWPIQCALYYSKANYNKIQKIVSEDKYDAVVVDMVRLAPYFFAFEDFTQKRILDIDDTLSKRYRRQLKLLDKKTVIAGQYNEKLPGFVQKILSSRLIKKAVLKFEIPRMERAEQYFGDLYDNAIFVSSIETDEFNKKYGGNKAVTVAMGVDYTFFSEECQIEIESGTASFVGNMKTAANADSVRMIVDKILPLSKQLKKLYLIGDFEALEKASFNDRDDRRTSIKEYLINGIK